MPNPDTLYDFQRDGVAWFQTERGTSYHCPKNWGLLGDEMGLGKTAQALTIVRSLIEKGLKGLFIVPGATTIQWQKQFDKWVLDCEPDEFGLSSLYSINSGKDSIPLGMSCVMSHALLTKVDLIQRLVNSNFDFIVIDEIHKFGSHGTKRIKHLWALINLTESKFEAGRIGLSGTPVRNYAKEIHNIAQFLCFPPARVYEDFCRKYLTYDRKALYNPQQFHMDFGPFYLRRMVSDVQKSLPSIRRTKLYTKITDPYIAKAYNKQLDLMTNFMENASRTDSFSILGYLMKLRHITGIAKARESAIIEPIREYLTEGGPDGTPAKVVIGIHHHYVAAQLQKSLSEFPFYIIRGGMDTKQKDRVKADFIACTAPAICLLSIKAAGEGIDGLQFASCKAYVFEQQWNMQDIFQFEKRIHRNGQTHPVSIENTIATGTVEEFFVNLCEEKLRYTTQVEDINWEANPAFLRTLAETVISNRISIPSQRDMEEFERAVKPMMDINETVMVGDYEL